MTGRITSEEASESLVRAFLHHATRSGGPERDAHRPPRMTIAISREVGARGSEVACEVGKRLGWKVYDRELLEQIAADMHVRVNLLESVDERRVNWLEGFAESFLLGMKVSENSYAKHLIETMVGLAARGHCVIVGRGAAHLLPLTSMLRVRVVAPREARIVAVAEEKSLSLKAAEDYIDQTEPQRRRFVLDHFQADPNVAANYDLVLNTARWSMSECADLVVDGLERLRRRALPVMAAVGA